MTFDPTKNAGYNRRSDRKDKAASLLAVAVTAVSQGMVTTETAQETYDRRRRAYLKSLQFRISEQFITAEGITWTPTIKDRNDEFQRLGRETLVRALARASYEEKQALEAYVADTEALKALLRHGRLPHGLKDHWRHPIRGGGSLRVENVCLMTAEAQLMLKEKRIDPAIHAAYADAMPDIERHAEATGLRGATRLDKIEGFAASFLVNPRYRRLPFSLIRPLRIGMPLGVVCIDQKDIDLRASLHELGDLKAAIDNGKPRRVKPAQARHIRRDGGPRR